MKRLSAAAAGAALVLVVGLTGCSGSSSSTKSGNGTLTIFDHDSLKSPQGQQLIAEYEKSHPHTQVKVLHVPSSGPDTIINAQMAGGTASDIMALGTNQQTWKDLQKNWWMDLTADANAPDPYVKGNKKWIDLLTPGAQASLKFKDGKIYSLSTTGFDVGFFYNKTIFSKLGLNPPQTWSEMVADFKKIKAAGYTPLEFELGDHQYADQAPAFLTILEGTVMHDSIQKMDANHDGTVDVQEMVDGIKNGTYSAKNADYQESWKLLKSLAPYFQFSPSSAKGSQPGLSAFQSGKVATWFEGSFNSPSIGTKAFKWGAFPMPRVDTAASTFGTDDATYPTGAFGACCGYPLSIPVTTKTKGNLKAAKDFIYWLSEPKNAQRYADQAGVLNMEQGAKTPADLQAFAQAASHVSAFGGAELSLHPDFITKRATLTEEYVTGALTLDAAMQQMQQAMDAAAEAATKTYSLK